MSQSVKELLIRLNGEVGKGASQIGDYLTGLGNTLDIIGSKTREFQKESVGVYQSYEDQMLAARFALSASVSSATELERQMAGLDEAARKWASTSIFHTDDVSKAINEAAHAGWQYQEILEGIPQAMLIAQAGGLDLSSGLDYLVKMMNATKTPMSEVGTIVDQWAMAANVSATNIDELGEAFISMGAAAQFGDSTAELFSMLAALANVGTTGSKAGTALRNTIMRLIAPTTKAEAAMDLLGADAEELQEVLTDTNVTKAAKTLEGLGFTAFDEKGRLKPVKQIFEELFKITENLDEAAKDELLAAIFPTRTIATALSLLSASDGELQKIFDKVSNSEGYAQKGADIMMSGLTGSIETLKSKWEELERSVGETMAPQIESLAGWLGNVVDDLNNMSPETMAAITSMLTTLSAAGPLLIGVGALSKMVGLLGPVGTAATLAGLGVSFLYGYIDKLSQIKFEENFGTLEVDIEELSQYVDSIDTKFDTEGKAIEKWSAAVSEAQTNYNKALTGMNEGLLKKVLTGGTFTDDDFAAFTKLGDDIVKYTMQGIENAEARDQSLLQALFGDKKTEGEAETFENLSGLMDFYYGDLTAEAQLIGEGIRMKMTEALKNGELTAEDREAIQAQIKRLNEINAQISAGMQRQAYFAQLEAAGRVSWDTVDTFLKDNEEKLKAENAAIDKQYDDLWGMIELGFERARETGDKTVTYKDLNGEERTIDVSKEAYDEAHRQVNRERAEAHESAAEKFGGVSMRAFRTLMGDSGFEDAWDYMQALYALQGGVPTDANGNPTLTALGPGGIAALGLSGKSKEEVQALYEQMDALRKADSGFLGLGTGKLTETLSPFKAYSGVAQMMQILALDDKYETALLNYLNSFDQADRLESQIADLKGRILQDDGRLNLGDVGTLTREELNFKYGTYIGGLYDELAAAEQKLAEIRAMQNGEVQLGVDDKEVQEYEPPEKTGVVKYVPTVGGENPDEFGYGGRATEASIFGEAGAEWAIPEAHTERTASLLNAAREASGFTWGDLIARFGGLGANPGNSPVVLNYSPVINAGDAGGIAGILAADKERVLKMIRRALEESRYRESVEVFA